MARRHMYWVMLALLCAVSGLAANGAERASAKHADVATAAASKITPAGSGETPESLAWRFTAAWRQDDRDALLEMARSPFAMSQLVAAPYLPALVSCIPAGTAPTCSVTFFEDDPDHTVTRMTYQLAVTRCDNNAWCVASAYPAVELPPSVTIDTSQPAPGLVGLGQPFLGSSE